MKGRRILRGSAFVLLFACLARAEVPASPETPPPPGKSVILFVLDNSASLPPLDPEERRRVALERMFAFVGDQTYRLVLFGGREEIAQDSPDRYLNTGQWTDFYYAFVKVREIIGTYPDGTDFKIILVTDGVLDPSPTDWAGEPRPEGTSLKQGVGEKTVRLLEEMAIPLYVILIGDQTESELVQAMVRAANGSLAANRYAQGLSGFLDDDGLLLRRFIYRLEPEQGLVEIEPIVRRIAAQPTAGVEVSIVASLALLVAVLIGVGVRSFPGPGDHEVVELRADQPVHIAVDRLRRLASNVPAWSWRGLSLVDTSKNAVATLKLIEGGQEFPPEGLDLSSLGPIAGQLIHLDLPALRGKMDEFIKSGNKQEMVEALNLDYVAADMEAVRVERLLTCPPPERRTKDPMDFLRAKVHLLHDDTLRGKLTGPRVQCTVFGSEYEKRELRVGDKLKLGRYTFRVGELGPGRRGDYRLRLSYEGVPSPLWLKRVVPKSVQRVLRLRRAHERTVA